MAQCKYCHETISRLDKDVCPFCGGVKPLDGTDTSTQDVTKVIDQLEHPTKIKHKKRIVAAILSILFGFIGLNHVYLGKYKRAAIVTCLYIAFIAGVGSILFFIAKWHSALAFLIPYFVVEFLSCFSAYCYLTKHSIQDSHGEFLE